MELCSKERMLNISEYVMFYILDSLATCCFADGAASPWPSFNELHDVVTRNGFHFSDVSCQGICGISCLFNGIAYHTTVRIHIMARTNRLKNWRSVSPENDKTLSVSPRTAAKPIKHRDATGSHEDRPRKRSARVIAAAENKLVADTSLPLFRGDCESGLYDE